MNLISLLSVEINVIFISENNFLYARQRFWLWFRYGMVREYHSAVTINLAKRLEIPIRNFSRNEL